MVTINDLKELDQWVKDMDVDPIPMDIKETLLTKTEDDIIDFYASYVAKKDQRDVLRDTIVVSLQDLSVRISKL